MAERPIFTPAPDTPELVRAIPFELVWNGGFAPVQKKKNIIALHAAAAAAGYSPLLEISTKGDEKIGQHLSAFHLKVHSERTGDIPLECAYQGSKVFENAGPYTDLYFSEVRAAKRDERLRTSSKIVAFVFDGFTFPLEPKTVFYDWLYVNAIFPYREWLKPRLSRYAGFTDIEFNPSRSVNCQARSCALFVALMATNLLERAVESPSTFIHLMSSRSYEEPQKVSRVQNHELFSK